MIGWGVKLFFGCLEFLTAFWKTSKPVTETRIDVKRNDSTLGDAEPPEIR